MTVVFLQSFATTISLRFIYNTIVYNAYKDMLKNISLPSRIAKVKQCEKTKQL